MHGCIQPQPQTQLPLIYPSSYTSTDVRLCFSLGSKTWPQLQHPFSAYAAMRSSNRQHEDHGSPDKKKHDLEIVRAVAQAWHSRSTSPRLATPVSEFDTRRLNFKSQPSRFKIEGTRKVNEGLSLSSVKYRDDSDLPWDFSQSLWDSYEIVTVSKRLEMGLVFDGSCAGIDELGRGLVERSRVVRRKRESRNSLRNLFNLMSSRRFNDPEAPNTGR